MSNHTKAPIESPRDGTITDPRTIAGVAFGGLATYLQSVCHDRRHDPYALRDLIVSRAEAIAAEYHDRETLRPGEARDVLAAEALRGTGGAAYHLGQGGREGVDRE